MSRVLLSSILLLASLCAQAQYFPHLKLSRFFDNRGQDMAKRIVRSSDGHLILGGQTIVEDAWGENCGNIWLVKSDTSGQIMWEQEVRMSGCEELRDLAPTQDGGVLFAGVTASLVHSEEQGDNGYSGNVFVGKIDSVGLIEWIQSYGGSQLDQAYGLTTIADRQDCMVVGGSHSADGQVGQNAGMSDLWAFRLNGGGKIEANQVLGGPKQDWGTAIVQAPSGNFWVAAFSHSPSHGTPMDGQGWLLQLSPTGEVQWQRTLYQPNGGYISDIALAPDGRIILAGYQMGKKGTRNFWWMALTQEGDKLWEWHPESADDERFTSVDVCDDGGLILGGYSVPREGRGSYAKGGEDFWLMRTNSYGQIIWRKTYGGVKNERCMDVLYWSPHQFYALGQKVNYFTRGEEKADHDYWLLGIQELPAKAIKAGIFVRAKNYKLTRKTPTRFRATYEHADRFLWDFGDGTYSEERQPLKSYALAGSYQVRLTVFVNETCQETVSLKKEVEVW